jgi:D-alanyl-D-alanine carboxypeptidase
MMKHYSGKIIFACVLVLVALASRAAYPRLYPVATGNAASGATPSAGAVPQFVLPALSLATVSHDAASATTSVNTDPGASADGPLDAAVVTQDTNAISVISQGSAANSVFSRVGAAEPPSLPVESALVADLTTGTHFMGENATERWPLASVTKLMTASIVLDKLSSAQKITITTDAFNADPTEKTLRVGDTYTVTDLLKFLLLPSSNVAAEALADAYGRAQFIA